MKRHQAAVASGLVSACGPEKAINCLSGDFSRSKNGKLAFYGEQFVMPLDVVQDRRRDLCRVATDAAGRISSPVHAGRLLEPELPEDRAPELIADRGAKRQAEARSHRHAHVADAGCVRVGHRSDGVQGLAPVVDHPVDHDVETFSGDPCLIGGGTQRRSDPVAVVGPVDRERGDAGLGAERAGQGQYAIGSLMSATAMPEQNERTARRPVRRQPQQSGNGTAATIQPERPLGDAFFCDLLPEPPESPHHSSNQFQARC
jgi:hypothetical protein